MVHDIHGADGPAVLLLGDSGMPGIAWEIAHVPALRRAGLTPITAEFRDVSGSCTISELAQDVAELIRRLHLGPMHVLGFAQGGFIAEQLAVMSPDLLHSITLVASAGPTTAYHRVRLQALQGLVEAGVRLPDELFVADHLVHGLPASLLQDNDEEVEKWITNLSLRPYEESAELLAQRAACRAWLLADGREANWRTIKTRCLIAAFQGDLLFPPSAARRCAMCIRGAELVVMSGTGSVDGFLDTADELSAIVTRFVQRPHGTPGVQGSGDM